MDEQQERVEITASPRLEAFMRIFSVVPTSLVDGWKTAGQTTAQENGRIVIATTTPGGEPVVVASHMTVDR